MNFPFWSLLFTQGVVLVSRLSCPNENFSSIKQIIIPGTSLCTFECFGCVVFLTLFSNAMICGSYVYSRKKLTTNFIAGNIKLVERLHIQFGLWRTSGIKYIHNYFSDTWYEIVFYMILNSWHWSCHSFTQMILRTQ
jgi:hypothetical protein